MESYILRLYRKGDGDKDKIAGLLEEVGKGALSSFRSFEELRQLLLSEKVMASDLTEKRGDPK